MDMVKVIHQRWDYHRTSVSNIRNDKTSRSHEDQQFHKVLAIGNMIATALKSTRQIGGSETIYHAHEGDWAMSGWLIPVIPPLRRRFVGEKNFADTLLLCFSFKRTDQKKHTKIKIKSLPQTIFAATNYIFVYLQN